MEVSVKIQCDLNNNVEKSFVEWLHSPQVCEDNQRLKDAVLIGYYITVNGIHAFYKNYFENDFKSICEAELAKLEREKQEFENRVRYQFDQDKYMFEKRIEVLRQEKDQLEQQSQDEVKRTASFYEQRYQGEMQLLKIGHQSTLRELQSKFDVASNELATMRAQERVAESQLLEQINYLKIMLQDKDAQLRDAYTSEKKDRIQTLETLVQQKEAEIHTLKTCNYIKGNLGEQTIMNALREYYPRHDIKHTGKTACEGDIHMIDTQDNTLVLLESKYKQTIDKNDIDKFCRDVSAVSEKQTSTVCVGGVFISLLTKNIPGKGDVHMDIIGGIPVLYVGFRNVDEFAAVFKKYLDMFLTLTKFHNSQGVKESTLDELFNDINFYFNLIQKNKTRVEDFKKNTLAKLTKFIADIENDTKILESRMEDLLRKNNCLKYETSQVSYYNNEYPVTSSTPGSGNGGYSTLGQGGNGGGLMAGGDFTDNNDAGGGGAGWRGHGGHGGHGAYVQTNRFRGQGGNYSSWVGGLNIMSWDIVGNYTMWCGGFGGGGAGGGGAGGGGGGYTGGGGGNNISVGLNAGGSGQGAGSYSSGAGTNTTYEGLNDTSNGDGYVKITCIGTI